MMTNEWIYKGRPVTDEDTTGFAGFIYIITDTETNRKYIGRKYTKFSRKLKRSDKRRTTFESDWKDYYGSSKVLQDLVEEHGKDRFKREIICFGKTKGEVNYLEVACQFHLRVLESDKFYNDSINKWKKASVKNYHAGLKNMREFFED